MLSVMLKTTIFMSRFYVSYLQLKDMELFNTCFIQFPICINSPDTSLISDFIYAMNNLAWSNNMISSFGSSGMQNTLYRILYAVVYRIIHPWRRMIYPAERGSKGYIPFQQGR